MSNAKVSVCIPIYNGSAYLERCLNSAVEQTYTNLEILVVDDCSTDASQEIVEKFQERDSRIRLVRNTKNLGLVGNWNRCLKESRGEWIKFLFQDDTMHADCVEKMYKAAADFSVKMVICGRKYIFEQNSDPASIDFIQNLYTLNSKFDSRVLLSRSDTMNLAMDRLFYNFIGEPIALFFHRTVLSEGNYNKDLVQLVDYEFALRIALNYEVVFLPEKLVSFRVHNASESANQSEIKSLKFHYVEPLIMYHEYLFNKGFKALRNRYGYLKLLKEAVGHCSNHGYRHKVPPEMKVYLFSKYPGLKLINRLGNIKNRLKKSLS